MDNKEIYGETSTQPVELEQDTLLEENLDEVNIEDVADNEEVKEIPDNQAEIDEIVKKRIAEINKQKISAKEEADKAKKERDEARKELEQLKKHLPKALEGVTAEKDTVKAVQQLAADNLGISLEQYQERLKNEELVEEAKRIKENQITTSREAIRKSHLDEIKKAYPSLNAESIDKVPNYNKFKALMMTNEFTSLEAFELVNKDFTQNKNDEYERQKALNDSREHLRSVNSRTVANSLQAIPKTEYDAWRECYPDLDEKTLQQKYWNSKK